MYYIQAPCKEDFPQAIAYNRFVELQQKALVTMTVFLQLCCPGKFTGMSFIDSTPLRTCHIKRGCSHSAFKILIINGKALMKWILGFKSHIVINDKDEILNLLITRTYVDDQPAETRGFIRVSPVKYSQIKVISPMICSNTPLLTEYT